MCEVGDIILIESYKHGNLSLSRHSFVVLSVDAGNIEGLHYDFVCNVLSSFKNEQQRKKKLEFPGNFEIFQKDSEVPKGNKKSGYIKSEQLYYFNNQKTQYTIIGNLHPNALERLFEFIKNLDIPIKDFIDNL
ncbi:MAG: hypothetical protein FWC67_04400 [Defluviitaleaceae bacterium]|nr:hypothetical protein [Defluviitaleaceae bacterium]